MKQISSLTASDEASVEPGTGQDVIGEDEEGAESENVTLALPHSKNDCVNVKQDLQDCIDEAKGK